MVSLVNYRPLYLVSNDGSISITYQTSNGFTNIQTAGGGGVPASPTTSVQFNNAGAFGGSANFTYNTGTNTVSFGNITGSALAMTIQPLAPTSGSAGALTVQARAGVATNGAGGALNLTAGSSVGTANGGNFTCTAGNGNINAGANGGSMFFTGGSGYFGGGMIFAAGAGGFSGGNLSFAGGSGSNGGSVGFTSGAGTSGSAGNFSFSTAVGNLGSGNMLMETGEVTFSGDSGALNFVTGAAAQNSDGGLSGKISFVIGNTGSIYDGWSGTAGSIIFKSGSDIGNYGSAGDINFTAGYGASYNGSINISTASGKSIQLADNGARQLGFFGATPVAQPTTATASATRAAVIGTVANIGDTYDGYTLAKVVKALRNLGILA